jgi:hypothetical protein
MPDSLPGGEPPYAAGVVSRSLLCSRDDHDLCPHWAAVTVGGLWRLSPRPEVVLCDDPCHRDRRCPLAGRRKATQAEWSARCTCPGAEASRRSFEKIEARRGETAAVFADVELSDAPDAEAIESRLRSAYRAHGAQPPRDLTGMSRVMAAGTSRHGTRSARLLTLGVRAAVRAAQESGSHGGAHRDLQKSIVALAGIAALLTAVAARTSGRRRLPLAIAAVLLWLFTARTIALSTLLTTLLRRSKRPV